MSFERFTFLTNTQKYDEIEKNIVSRFFIPINRETNYEFY